MLFSGGSNMRIDVFDIETLKLKDNKLANLPNWGYCSLVLENKLLVGGYLFL